jgi:hypothetical protein
MPTLIGVESQWTNKLRSLAPISVGVVVLPVASSSKKLITYPTILYQNEPTNFYTMAVSFGSTPKFIDWTNEWWEPATTLDNEFFCHPFYLSCLILTVGFRLLCRSARVGQEFQPKARLFEATVGMADKIVKTLKSRIKNQTRPQVGALHRPSLRSKGLRFAQETRPPKNSPRIPCRHVGNHVIFSSMLESFHRRSLSHNLNPDWWNNSFYNQSYNSIPVKLLTNWCASSL